MYPQKIRRYHYLGIGYENAVNLAHYRFSLHSGENIIIKFPTEVHSYKRFHISYVYIPTGLQLTWLEIQPTAVRGAT